MIVDSIFFVPQMSTARPLPVLDLGRLIKWQTTLGYNLDGRISEQVHGARVSFCDCGVALVDDELLCTCLGERFVWKVE